MSDGKTRVAPRERAGTPLTTDISKRVDISFPYFGKLTRHGTVDLENRFYQIGGQYSDFHYRKLDLITMPWEVWEQVKEYANYLNFIEWYDREQDVAYVVSYDDAILHGRAYANGIGKRFGVPHSYFIKIQERLRGEMA